MINSSVAAQNPMSSSRVVTWPRNAYGGVDVGSIEGRQVSNAEHGCQSRRTDVVSCINGEGLTAVGNNILFGDEDSGDSIPGIG